MAERWNQSTEIGQHNLSSSSWPSSLPGDCNGTAGEWNCTGAAEDYTTGNSYYFYNGTAATANVTDWINSTRPEDNLIFTSLTSAILGVLILATIVGNFTICTPLLF